MRPELGVCYYPEHWPEARWAADARHMVAAGLSWVRIGEFAWSRLEPSPQAFDFAWLDRAIECLGSAGLKIVLGTPTATPPRWMLDCYPDMLAVDEDGQTRQFGSRRHYCFSHQGYLDACCRITRLLGQRYGANPHIAAWQIDNEYGCHETVVSYSAAARAAFVAWLEERYGTIAELNEAWGNVFWSMDYQRFDQIDLPRATVTVPNPAHVLAFRRFSSDQVMLFNRAQADILRDVTDAPLLHNYMGRELAFDHFQVGADLDIASWDSYPIGFLSDRLDLDKEHKLAFLRQGDPDCQAFHHDLYRTVGRGRWWVMEQQPGPVNWAPHNPAPLPGMVKLWTLEAIAHGAEVVSYFRWRQAPFAQEQMHAGLLDPAGEAAPALAEIADVTSLLGQLGENPIGRADVAIIFEYAADWAFKALPQGEGFDYFNLVFSLYRALRRCGVNIDIVPAAPEAIAGYRCVFAPGLATVCPALDEAFSAFRGLVVLGPRTGALTQDHAIPPTGRPAISSISAKIDLVESFPPEAAIAAKGGDGAVVHWLERLKQPLPVETRTLLQTEQNDPILIAQGTRWYLAGYPNEALWDRLVSSALHASAIETRPMPAGLRRRCSATHAFLMNYNAAPVTYEGVVIDPCGVVIERL